MKISKLWISFQHMKLISWSIRFYEKYKNTKILLKYYIWVFRHYLGGSNIYEYYWKATEWWLNGTEWHWMVTEWSLKCTCHSVDWMVTEWWLNGAFQFSRNGGVSSCGQLSMCIFSLIVYYDIAMYKWTSPALMSTDPEFMTVMLEICNRCVWLWVFFFILFFFFWGGGV